MKYVLIAIIAAGTVVLAAALSSRISSRLPDSLPIQATLPATPNPVMAPPTIQQAAPSPAAMEQQPVDPEPIAAMERSTATVQLTPYPPSEVEPTQSELIDTPAIDDPAADGDLQLTLEQTARASTSLRNADFPRTYIRRIDVDLTSSNHWVRLTWAGPQAASQESGPFHSSPGRGLGNNDCDDAAESNRNGSNCTPKGTFAVRGFSNSMETCSVCRFVTWFQIERGIAFHYYPDVPGYPASHGCVRLEDLDAAQLIHNNAKVGATEVIVDGNWEFLR